MGLSLEYSGKKNDCLHKYRIYYTGSIEGILQFKQSIEIGHWESYTFTKVIR